MRYKASLLLLACFSFMQATAQDMTTIHMKDGTVLSFENGRHNVTNIRFWENPESEQLTNAPDIQINNNNNDYTVLLSVCRIVTLPTKQSTLSVCIGTAANLTIQSCECVIPGTEDNDGTLYFQIGEENALKKANWNSTIPSSASPLPVYNYPLQKGQTYYWRAIMRVPYQQGGQRKEAIVYDSQEYSFQIP